MVSKETCSHRIFRDFSPQHCSKKVVDGTVFCKIHNPEYIKEKSRKSREAWDAKWQAEKSSRTLADAAVNGCKAMNPGNPLAVAQNIKGMVTALTAIASCGGNYPGDVVDIAKQALAKVMGEVKE